MQHVNGRSVSATKVGVPADNRARLKQLVQV